MLYKNDIMPYLLHIYSNCNHQWISMMHSFSVRVWPCLEVNWPHCELRSATITSNPGLQAKNCCFFSSEDLDNKNPFVISQSLHFFDSNVFVSMLRILLLLFIIIQCLVAKLTSINNEPLYWLLGYKVDISPGDLTNHKKHAQFCSQIQFDTVLHFCIVILVKHLG